MPENRRRKRKSRLSVDEAVNLQLKIYRILRAIGVVLVVFTAFAAFPHMFPKKAEQLSYIMKRVHGALTYRLSDRSPQVYAIMVEKNGSDVQIPCQGPFDVTSRDEFVIRDVASDALSGEGFTVDVVGVGGINDYQVLLRGIDLVDLSVAKISEETLDRGYAPGQIRIVYEGKLLTTVPMRIRIMPQDWLRYAKASEDRKKRIEYLKRAAAANPKDLVIRRTLGEIYRLSEMIPEAIAEFQGVLDRKPDDAKALAGLIKTYLSAEQNNLAVKAGEHAVKVTPGEPALWEDLIVAYSRLGLWDKAAASCRSLVQLKPRDYTVRIRLAEIYEKMGKESEAIEQYRIVMEKAPNAGPIVEGMARVYLKQGRYEEAIRILTNLTRKKPPSAAVYANLGSAYGGKKMWKEELGCYRKAVALSPRDPVILYNFAISCENNNRDQEALNAYEKVLSLKPGDTEAMLRLADLAFKNRRYAQAIGLYEKLVVKLPQKGKLYANLGYAYGELNQLGPSAKNYENAIKAGVKDEKVTYNLAATYEKMGKDKAAAALYGKAASQKPTAEALNRLADYYIKTGQYDQAVNTYRRLLKMDTKNGGVYADLGYVYGLRGELDKEIENYKTSLRYNSEEGDVYCRLGGAYEKKGLLAEALQAYTKAYQLNPGDEEAGERIPRLKIRLLREKHEKESKKEL
jgi:tetratricopeptide (TPR) repeat protein